MKAVGLTQYLPINNENSLLDVEISKPTAKGKDLLVQVKAISVNPVETKVRSPKDKVESEPLHRTYTKLDNPTCSLLPAST